MLKTKACTAYQRQMQPSPSQTLWSMPTKALLFLTSGAGLAPNKGWPMTFTRGGRDRSGVIIERLLQCWEPLAPGLSFCWGPELEGSTSPCSTWSSTPGRAGRDQREVHRAPARTPPARAPSTLHAPRTDPAHSHRLARLASTSPLFAFVCAQEINVALLSQPGSRAVQASRVHRREVLARRRAVQVLRRGACRQQQFGRRQLGQPVLLSMGQKRPPHSDSFCFIHCDLFFRA